MNWISSPNVSTYLFFWIALRRSLKLVIQMVTYCDANSGANTSVHYTIYDFIDSICIRKIPYVSILYCSIVQTNLSVAYIQQKYDYPYHIFGVLHKTYCVNIVTWYVKEMYILKIAKYSRIKIWKNSLIEWYDIYLYYFTLHLYFW